MADNKEKIQWVMTVMNTFHSVFDTMGDITGKLPDDVKRKVPGFLGLSLADEQIFWGLVGQLEKEKSILINKFLNEKCSNQERNRFINIVAGMEVSPGKPEENEKKYDPKTGNLTYEKTKAGSNEIDYRKEFLETFADIIQDDFGGDMDKVYDFCVAGRMIVKPIQEKIKEFWEDLEIVSPIETEKKYQGPFSQVKRNLKKLFGR
jgi:hypothetical protein